MSSSRRSVIVTCGGTTEPIDDVRAVTNFSSGRFGQALATELAEYDFDVIQLSPRSTRDRFGLGPGVDHEVFTTSDDLRAALLGRETVPNIVLMAAAVSDYRPVKVEGKISSDSERLVVEMERVEKILPQLRPTYGPKTFLVGFKLLSGVSRAELVTAARKQLAAGRLNMVIANDLTDLRDGLHPVLVVTAEGGVIPFSGTRGEVARELAAFIVEREQVDWFSSHRVDADPHDRAAAQPRFDAALALAKDMNLLTDASGNISVAADTSSARLLVSPRGVDKSRLTPADAIVAAVDVDARTISYSGERKPSIDTGVEAWLYRMYPHVKTVLHFHRGWGRAEATTTFPYPCGVAQEAGDIVTSLVAAGRSAGEPDGSAPLSVELIHHGFLLGLADGHLADLLARWAEVRAEFVTHIDEVRPVDDTELHPIDASKYRPIWDGAKIVGLIHDDPDAAVVYLTESSRGSGVGRVVVEQLIEREYTIQTVDACEVRDFYARFGFVESRRGTGYELRAPKASLERRFDMPGSCSCR